MSKPQHWLGALLAVQILLTGGLYARTRQLEAQQSQSASVLSFQKDKIDKLVVSDKDKKITLSKTGGGWQLPDYHNLPADPDKVDDLLLTLSDLKGGWAVATSESSHPQFEVAADKFARKIDVLEGDKAVAELYMGTSPGFRKTHVRAAKDSNVYAAEINSMDVPVAEDQWFDKGLLKAKDPTVIKGPGYQLSKSGADWKLEGAQGTLNQTNAVGLAKMLTTLRVDGWQAGEPSGQANLTYEVTEGGKPLTYSFWLQGETVVARRSDNPNSFTLSKPLYESLSSYTLAKMTENPPTPQAKAPAASPTPGAPATGAPPTPAAQP